MNGKRGQPMGLAIAALAFALGAAPAPPSYQGVQSSIDDFRAATARANQAGSPNAQRWESLFQALTAELKAYSEATDLDARSIALGRLQQYEAALGAMPYTPVVGLHRALADWLAPRRNLIDIERQIRALLAGANTNANPSEAGYRQGWFHFLDDDLGRALRDYERAATVADRMAALGRLRKALAALQASNASTPWGPSLSLSTAVGLLYSQPNLDVSADAHSLASYLSANLVTTGPVERKGYVSYVTAGPHLGWGLMDSDDGIAFYNRQAMTSSTQIWDFQNQIAQDRQGKRAAKLYQFGATSFDAPGVLTVVAVVRPTGLQLFPENDHNVALSVDSTPIPGHSKGTSRFVASLVGYNQERITQKVWEGAIGKVQENVVKESAEETQERVSAEAAERTAAMSKFLVGNNTLALDQVAIVGLSLRSRTTNALVGGTVIWRAARDPIGADSPQPARLLVPDPGISADVHLGSILNGLARGYFATPEVTRVQNLLIETRKREPNLPLREAVSIRENAKFAEFAEAVKRAQAVGDSSVTALRIHRPARPPEFSTDRSGNLVALIYDVMIDIPAQGGKLYRVTSPMVEVVANFTAPTPQDTARPRVTARLVDVDFGPKVTVSEIFADDRPGQPVPLGIFILNVARASLRNKTYDLPLDTARIPGFALTNVTPLDPSGWMRVVLTRTP